MSHTPSIRTLLQSARQRLRTLDSAGLDCEILLAAVIKQDRTFLYSHPGQVPGPAETADFHSLVSKRAEGFPLAYLTGHREFWSLQLNVNRTTLIPRPETELLVETVLELTAKEDRTSILDLGTGSGAIAIAIAGERPGCAITATDISAEALSVARDNAMQNKVAAIRFVQSDWFNNLERNRYDIIVSNPPYVESQDPGLIAGEIRHEPRVALDGGPAGLDAIRRITATAGAHLGHHGWLLLEHGSTQGKAVRDLLYQYRFHKIETRRDYSGHERITCACYPY